MMAQGTRCPRGHRKLFYFTVILTAQKWTLQDQLGCLFYGPPEEAILDNPSLNTHWPECVQIPLPSALYSNSEFSHRETDHSSLSRAGEFSRRRFSMPNPGPSLTNQVNLVILSLGILSFSVCLPDQTPSALSFRTKYNTFLTCTHTAAETKSICRSPKPRIP